MNSIFFTSQHKTLTFKGGVGRFLAFLQASKLFVVQIYVLNEGIQSSALSSLRCLQVVRVYNSYEKRVRFRCKSFKSQKSTTYCWRVQTDPVLGDDLTFHVPCRIQESLLIFFDMRIELREVKK